ncbi:MAG: 2,3-butanediol dehydrogenase [Candidatus Tectimicrobiota bacterium]|nr:MAG: 2,3-butanediol dehydrogenase [Candidatus Tectomicrobia bacterium]
MQAARWYAARDVRVEEVAERPLQPGEVRLQVKWCGLCGSDLHEYTHGPVLIPTRPHPLTGKVPPVTLGHEFAAEVVEVGPQVTAWQVGDRVTASACLVCHRCPWCRAGRFNLCERLGSIGLCADGAFAEQVVVPDYTLFRLPEGLSWEAGALAEPAAVALHACKQGRLQPGDTVAVVGAGPIGLLVLQAARSCGAARVFVVEPVAGRRRLAEALGAEAALDPTAVAVDREIHQRTGGLRAEVVFECVGTPPAVETAVKLAGKGGRVVLVGIYTQASPLAWGRIQAHEKTLVGASAYTDEFPLALAMLADGRLQAAPLVTDRIPLRDLATRGLQQVLAEPDRHVKILVSPQ